MHIEITNISKHYKKKTILKNIHLEAQSGDCIAILGQNGSGKSTLLSILTGILQADEGKFLYDGQDLLTDKNLRSKIVGYVPQGTPLLEELTAKDHLKLWYSNANRDLQADLINGVPAMLEISDFLSVPVHQMSGGMKKRLSIACAVAHNPEILLLDESSAALDFVCKEKIHNYYQRFLKSGGIILMVTHDAQDLALCNQFYILKKDSLFPYEYDGNIQTLTANL